MEKQKIRAEEKLLLITRQAPMGLAEIDSSGFILDINPYGKSLLKPILVANDLGDKNLLAVLDQIAPAVSEKIASSADDAGYLLTNDLHSFFLSFGGEDIERHFSFTVIKLSADCIIITFDDMTQKRQSQKAIQDLVADKAVLQGKFEIASNILHDIGNAVVGFGSYTSKIRRLLEQTNPENLAKLTEFLTAQQSLMIPVLGEAKADAVIKMLSGISESQKNNFEDIRGSITEQQKIITHIQDILTIQRQYVSGNELQEKKPINLRGIITDCMSMVYASIEKRGIIISVNIPDVLPVINGDRTRLMQVILNILKNSIEAINVTATEKNISLNVGVTDDMIVVQVKDNGHGFDEPTGKQLFERGFTTKASGTGLGLHSCKSIIENHDGSIEITSEGFGLGALTTIKFKI